MAGWRREAAVHWLGKEMFDLIEGYRRLEENLIASEPLEDWRVNNCFIKRDSGANGVNNTGWRILLKLMEYKGNSV